MVRIITKDELKAEPYLLERLKNSVFIYPTDTIYGIGCDATNDYLVERVRDIKNRHDQPFSIIVPHKKQVLENCENPSLVKDWISKLPGPYTLIMKVKRNFFSSKVNNSANTVGVRMPDHWVSDLATRMDTPLITTSVNISGEDFMTSLDDLDPEIKRKVDFIIYEGPLSGKPLTIVHLENDELDLRQI